MSDGDTASEGASQLPTDCPQCGDRLESRGDVMVHLFTHPEVWDLD